MAKLDLTVVILTYNEEKNIRFALESVKGWVKNIFIVDSFSTDNTLEIAREFKCKIYQNPWRNYASQLNWALKNLSIDTEWIMRLDADEIVTSSLRDELIDELPRIENDITGLYVNRRIYFLGKWMKHGTMYPIKVLRIWRKGSGYCEKRWMDEHIKIIKGKIFFLKNDIIDNNRNNLSWWINKHNQYATREAIDVLNIKYNLIQYDEVPAKIFGTQEQRKRWLKRKYAYLPLFLRPIMYFLYRYFIRLGFLDGKEGLVWHFLQAFWYRFLVDSKIYEMCKKSREDKSMLIQNIKTEYGIDLNESW